MNTLLSLFLAASLQAPVEDTAVLPPDSSRFGTLLPAHRIAKGPSSASGLAVAGDELHVLGDNKLWIYNVSSPSSPRLLGTLAGIANGRQVALDGSVAFIAARANGLYCIDVSRPSSPKLLSRFDTIELATGVDVSDGVACVSERVYGVEFVDVRNPSRPKHLSIFRTPESQSCVFSNGKLFSGEWAAGKLTILDVSDSSEPWRICEHPLGGFGDGLAVRGRYCFASTGHHAKTDPVSGRENNGHGLDIIDIANPFSPKTVARVQFPGFFSRGNDFWTVRLSGNFAACADSHNGIFLLDVSNPISPKFTGQCQLPQVNGRPDAVASIAFVQDGLFATGVKTGLYFIPLPQDFSKIDLHGQVRSTAVQENIAWTAAGSGGLCAVSLSTNGLSLLQRHNVPEAYCVAVDGTVLFSAEGSNGIAIYRTKEDGSLEKVSRTPLPDGKLAQQVWRPRETRFFVASDFGNELHFFDAQDLAKPRHVFRHRQISLLYGDLLCPYTLDGKWIACNWHSGGIAWYDLSGEVPRLGERNLSRLGGHLDGMTLFRGKLLWIRNGAFTFLSANQASDPANWRNVKTNFRATGIPSIDGNILALSKRNDCTVKLYDIAAPETPRELAIWRLPGNPGTVRFWQHKALIPCSHAGLLLQR